MNAARWDRIQELFHAGADLPEPERSEFLNQACGEDQALLERVRRMLEQDHRPSLLDRDVAQVAGAVLDSAPLKELGRYQIQRVLGEGGMGVVYLAERKDLGNLVAVKILRDAWMSPARRQRFASEQRMLAQLNHPAIARLYDADTLPDGTPWFVMEYVDGLPLTEYCERNQCPVEERLKLVRAVAEAVHYAHQHSVIHRDLKPSNILVKSDGSVRLLDFGIAKQLDGEGRPVNQTRTSLRPMTPAYAAPEQLRGAEVSVRTDIYSLGVVLYEVIAGRLPFDISNKTAGEAAELITTADPAKPSTALRRTITGPSRADLDALCLTAMNKDPAQRYQSAEELIRDIDHYLAGEPIEARRRSLRGTVASFARRNRQKALVAAGVLALVTAAVAATLAVSRRADVAPPRARTVAVLPLVNTGNDASVDFLRLALANEISTTLGYARSLSIRSLDSVGRYTSPTLDIQKAGRELHVENVVTGRFLKAGDQLQITLDVTEVDSGRLLWREVFDVPAQNTVAMQAQIAAKTRRALAPVLGVSEFVTENTPKPKNERAYMLYLRAKSMTLDMSTIVLHPEMSQQVLEILKQSVALDPAYAPAWEALADWYAGQGWFGTGGEQALQQWRALTERAQALDPDNVIFRAGVLYVGTIGGSRRGGLTRGEAYRQIRELLRQRPDSARMHFVVSWMLRDVGLLEEAARECDVSVLIDAQDAGARSCGITFMLRGNYRRAVDFVRLDPASEPAHAISIDVLLREGKQQEALAMLTGGGVPTWGGYPMLLAYLQHRPAAEISALALAVRPAPDPEVNYFSAAHLSYAGYSEAALAMLKATIEGGYCTFPAIDADPLFAAARRQPEYNQVRALGMACQNTFLSQSGDPGNH